MDQGRRGFLRHSGKAVPHVIPYVQSEPPRRTFLKKSILYLAGGLVALKTLPSLPLSYEQTAPEFPEFDVGTLQTPVVRDGKIGDHEYDDCVKSPFLVLPIAGFTGKANLYAKYDSDTTYLGFDFLTNNPDEELTFESLFDLKKSNVTEPGAPDIYYLNLTINSESVTESVTPGEPGTAFVNVFKKGIDYDYESSVGPSIDNTNPHTQLEVQIKNSILRQFSDEILFFSFLHDSSGVMVFPTNEGTGRGIMKFVSYALPEPSPALAGPLLTGLASLLLLYRNSKRSKF
jgi:hypothetical protein